MKIHVVSLNKPNPIFEFLPIFLYDYIYMHRRYFVLNIYMYYSPVWSFLTGKNLVVLHHTKLIKHLAKNSTQISVRGPSKTCSMVRVFMGFFLSALKPHFDFEIKTSNKSAVPWFYCMFLAVHVLILSHELIPHILSFLSYWPTLIAICLLLPDITDIPL